MACGRGSACDWCLEPAEVRLDWASISGHFCGRCAARLRSESEVAPELTLLQTQDIVPDTAVRL